MVPLWFAHYRLRGARMTRHESWVWSKAEQRYVLEWIEESGTLSADDWAYLLSRKAGRD